MIRRFVPDTVVARSVVILVFALIAVHLLGYWAYSTSADAVATSARDRALAERIVSIKRAVASIPDTAERDKTAHTLSSASLEVHWSLSSLVLGSAPLTDRATATAERLKELVPDLAAESFRIGFADDGATGEGDAYRHMLMVSVRLDDQSWVNFSTPRLGTVSTLDPRIMALSLCIAVVIIMIAALLLRWVTRPLSQLAEAAERFSIDARPKPLAEDGPQEVRRAAKAFNTMRERIQSLVGERTQALAAVSHDLRTPITRVRLRSELFEDAAMRELVEADLAEMESMIDATLEYLRAGESREPERLIDLAALVQTVVDDESDRGRDISFTGLQHAIVEARLMGVKRVLWNVIGNALKFATQVEVVLSGTPTSFVITVRDNGPGVPEELIERLFEPFFRVEQSRSRETGGSGLGLTITRSIMRAAGGDVTIRNNPHSGLSVSLVFLKASPTEAGRDLRDKNKVKDSKVHHHSP